MQTKFDLRKIAFSLLPFQSTDEATAKIKGKVAELKLSDLEIIEFIKQCNVANQYSAYKKAGFNMTSTNFDTVVINPVKLFNDLIKVSAFTTPVKTKNVFTNLKTAALRKSSALEQKFTPKVDMSTQLMEMVKVAKTNIDAKFALKKIRSYAEFELLKTKQQFFKTASKFEDLVKSFPYMRAKYANLVDVKSGMGFVSNRIPTAKDIVEMRELSEKLGCLSDEIAHINNILDIIGR